MDVVITGAAGFLGQKLTRELLAAGKLRDSSNEIREIRKIVLLDMVPAPGSGDERIEVVTGDISDPQLMARVISPDVGSVFHLAAVVSGQAEAEFDLGMRINVDASRLLLEACRRAGQRPKVLFTSSVAVYGGELPPLVTDATALRPQSSYGVQKAIAELLLADYSRKGFVDGRVVRLPTISVRPGAPNKAASSFASGIVREPLQGVESVCPVSEDTRLWLMSPRRAIDCLVKVHEVPAEKLQGSRTVNLPGLSVSVRQMIEALRTVGGDAAVAKVKWQRDPIVERIVGSWPAAWDTSRAAALGLEADASFEAMVRAFVEDELS